MGLNAREPFQTSSTLVIEGLYKFSRNPIYLSIIIILIGLAILAGSLSIFITVIVLFIIFCKFLVSWEEKNLRKHLGKNILNIKSVSEGGYEQ
ncbi:MAG: methyltransferase family protein [Candidatus Hermodarchaeota archaeon]